MKAAGLPGLPARGLREQPLLLGSPVGGGSCGPRRPVVPAASLHGNSIATVSSSYHGGGSGRGVGSTTTSSSSNRAVLVPQQQLRRRAAGVVVRAGAAAEAALEVSPQTPHLTMPPHRSERLPTPRQAARPTVSPHPFRSCHATAQASEQPAAVEVVQQMAAAAPTSTAIATAPTTTTTAGSAAAVVVAPLPEKNFGILRGGRYPFLYDNVYGLPIVRQVASYGEVLEGLRTGRIVEVLWFQDPPGVTPTTAAPRASADGRCLLRYASGQVKQSVIPAGEPRIMQAIEEHGALASLIPLEPRHVPELALMAEEVRQQRALYGAAEAAGGGDGTAALEREPYTGVPVEAPEGLRRGPAVAPTPLEAVMVYGTREQLQETLQDNFESAADDVAELLARRQALLQAQADMAAAAEADASRRRSDGDAVGTAAGGGGLLGSGFGVGAWLDNIRLSNEQQALVLKTVPLLGPVVGSAFIIGLYLLARLVKGDLTDRLKMMDSEAEKKKKLALKEARIAFLEEEVPGLVVKGATLDDIRKRCAAVNSRLGPKLEIADSEVVSTYEACRALLSEGVDLSAASSSAATASLAQMESDERLAAATAGEGGGEDGGVNALMEMSKLNTARIRKATDTKILDVKKRVREARRKLKRDSKVQMSDEIIFFDDVAGNAQAKVELMEVVDFFKTPEKFKACGARPPKGVLLVGPPGNGKTLMARAVAGESGVAFISSSAAEFIEMYMGLGAARVRDLFNTARSVAPCIIFIDELDAVGRQRQGGGKSNDERDNTVNQLLTEMDGFEAEQQGIVVMGATNRKDVLDTALTRPGRFDRSIEVRRPDFQGRLEAVKVHLRDKPIAADIDYFSLAGLMGGMSGAQIAGVTNSACFLASREGRPEVSQADLELAIEQAKYGRSVDQHRFVGAARRRRFAVMEAGISLAATLLPAIEPVEYVTIAPSTRSPLGRTVLEPHIGRYTTGVWTARYLREQLLVQLAGRGAEEVVLGREELSSLQQHRLQFARQIAYKMVNAGMSEHPDYQHIRGLGQNYLDPSSEPGRFTQYTITTEFNQTRSEAVDVDMEVEASLNGGYQEVVALLRRNRAALDALIELLLEREKVSGREVVEVVERLGHPDDLARRAKWAGYQLL
ncbi:hypothetical protein Agub_g7689 [Astrephomene gubernaculifera]|uniref:AAA+ ATPase domain-containing protein n=1 Tax=Astrephomene gubernaculifera TaxID=47775 RepID=A0AAD3HML7_9CHLO|nr:hypothetical protein Agub_g7689 [Astrephomene gubernaculifera]